MLIVRHVAILLYFEYGKIGTGPVFVGVFAHSSLHFREKTRMIMDSDLISSFFLIECETLSAAESGDRQRGEAACQSPFFAG